MPLPDAEPGQKSNLYSQLRSSQVQTISQTAFDQVKNPIFVNSEWEDEARRLKLWGELTGNSSASGPLMGSCKCVVTDSITTTNTTPVYTPAEGEIWQIMGMSVTVTNATGNTSFYSYISDSSSSIQVYMASTSSGSSNVALWSDVDYKNPIYITSQTTLEVNINSTSNLDSYVVKTALVRVR